VLPLNGYVVSDCQCLLTAGIKSGLPSMHRFPLGNLTTVRVEKLSGWPESSQVEFQAFRAGLFQPGSICKVVTVICIVHPSLRAQDTALFSNYFINWGLLNKKSYDTVADLCKRQAVFRNSLQVRSFSRKNTVSAQT
jgi:hypothetical protein